MNIAIIAIITLAINLFFGRIRRRYRKMTPMWWIMIHASIPFVVPLRIWLDVSYSFIPLFIGVAVLGQYLGGRRFFSDNT